MHPLIKNVEYAVRGTLPIRAEALSKVIDERKRKRNALNKLKTYDG